IIVELLGSVVAWVPFSKTVRATKGAIRITLSINSNQADVNGVAVALTQPAKIINDTTMVPLRFVSEALGGHVAWDGAARTVTIESEDYVRHLEENNITKPVMENKKITLKSKSF